MQVFLTTVPWVINNNKYKKRPL